MTVQLIVCQVCHTRQPNAWDCAVCGRPLHERSTAAGLVTETLPELELTSLGDGGDAHVPPVDGLELTALVDEGTEVPAAAGTVEGLEPTLIDDPGEPPPLRDPELEIEPTPLAPIEAPTGRGPVVCRYCSTPWREGSSRFCPRCGMRVV